MWHSQRHGVLGKLPGRDWSNKASIWFPLLSRNIAICPIKRDEMMMVMSQLSASIKLIGAVGLWVMYSVYQPTGLMERLGQLIIPHYYTTISPQTVFDRKFLNSLSRPGLVRCGAGWGQWYTDRGGAIILQSLGSGGSRDHSGFPQYLRNIETRNDYSLTRLVFRCIVAG